MADNKFLQEDHIAGGSFSQLLFSDEEVGLDSSGFFNYTTTFSYENSPKMLCFGDNHCNGFNLDAHKPGSITCSDSLLRSNKKRNGSAAIAKDVQSLITGTGAPAENQKNGKKNKSENSMATEHPKVVKKENLGERISALQQIVSPYGKTDTASVLHEAMGYIRFLHDQVQVLCSPYLQRLPSSSVLPYEGGENGGEEKSKNLMSRGLCLVPVEFTLHVANDNGADFWSPLTVDPTSEH